MFSSVADAREHKVGPVKRSDGATEVWSIFVTIGCYESTDEFPASCTAIIALVVPVLAETPFGYRVILSLQIAIREAANLGRCSSGNSP